MAVLRKPSLRTQCMLAMMLSMCLQSSHAFRQNAPLSRTHSCIQTPNGCGYVKQAYECHGMRAGIMFRSSNLSMSSSSSTERNKDLDRLESLKVGVTSFITGSLGAVPLSVIVGILQNFSAQWEFSVDMLALSLFLFGVVYRYAVREDRGYEQLSQGVVGAFAVTRTVASLHVPDTCASIPLNCGPPFYYGTPGMALDAAVIFGQSLVAYGVAAFAIEWAFEKGLIARSPPSVI